MSIIKPIFVVRKSIGCVYIYIYTFIRTRECCLALHLCEGTNQSEMWTKWSGGNERKWGFISPRRVIVFKEREMVHSLVGVCRWPPRSRGWRERLYLHSKRRRDYNYNGARLSKHVKTQFWPRKSSWCTRSRPAMHHNYISLLFLYALHISSHTFALRSSHKRKRDEMQMRAPSPCRVTVLTSFFSHLESFHLLFGPLKSFVILFTLWMFCSSANRIHLTCLRFCIYICTSCVHVDTNCLLVYTMQVVCCICTNTIRVWCIVNFVLYLETIRFVNPQLVLFNFHYRIY